MSRHHYPHLFSPIMIGQVEVPNRICHVPTDISSANADGSVNDRVVTYHEEIAKGGCGFIIVGATTPDKATGRPTVTCLAADEDPMIPGLARLAEAMHRHGAICSVQIQHPGRQAAWPRTGLFSATDMVVSLPGSAGHEVVYAESMAKGKSIRSMTVEEIYQLADLFAEAAWRIQQAGFDSVELHGAHGYLIAQFMSPYVNRRNDRFGGSLANRLRFPLEILDRIKAKCGRDFPVGIRYSGEEWIESGRELPESIKLARIFQEAGIAYLDISAGIFELPGPTTDPMYYPEGWNTYTAEEIKKHVQIPVITSHTLRDPAYCEQILAEGKTDLVGLSRQLIADPYWGNKAKAGKNDEIRKCISCLVGCWQESLMIKREMRCAVNPAVGDERFIHLAPAQVSRRLAVVGGGPGGMEAARIATLRGHRVTIFEKTGELGGAMLACCTVPGKNKMRWYADWLRHQVNALSIEVKYRVSVTPDDLTGFDGVVLATGSRVHRPDIPGTDLPFVMNYHDLLRCQSTHCEYFPEDKLPPPESGNRVLVWGDHFGATDTVEKLGFDGREILVVSHHREYAPWMEPCHRDVFLKRMVGGNGEGLKTRTFVHPVTVFANSTVTEIRENGDVVIMNNRFEKLTVTVDTVVLATVRPNNELSNQLTAAGLTVEVIGDAKKVRNLRGAVTDGADLALRVDRDFGLNANNRFTCDLPTDVKR